MTRANSWKLLTNIKGNSISNPVRIIDLTLIIKKMVYKQNGLSERLVLKQNHPKLINIVHHLHHSIKSHGALRIIVKREREKIFLKLSTIFLYNNIWSQNCLSCHKTCFPWNKWVLFILL